MSDTQRMPILAARSKPGGGGNRTHVLNHSDEESTCVAPDSTFRPRQRRPKPGTTSTLFEVYRPLTHAMRSGLRTSLVVTCPTLTPGGVASDSRAPFQEREQLLTQPSERRSGRCCWRLLGLYGVLRGSIRPRHAPQPYCDPVETGAPPCLLPSRGTMRKCGRSPGHAPPMAP